MRMIAFIKKDEAQSLRADDMLLINLSDVAASETLADFIRRKHQLPRAQGVRRN